MLIHFIQVQAQKLFRNDQTEGSFGLINNIRRRKWSQPAPALVLIKIILTFVVTVQSVVPSSDGAV